MPKRRECGHRAARVAGEARPVPAAKGQNRPGLICRHHAQLPLALVAELRELLRLHGFESDNAVILRGAAKPALEGDEKWVESITKLLDALDRYAPREASGVNS